ncbi:MAG: sulfatase-like hydrolase/transferase [Pyrinomonadaceae bacterium]
MLNKFRLTNLDAADINRLSFLFVLFSLFFESYYFGVNYSEYAISLYDSESVLFFAVGIILTGVSIYVYFRLIKLILSVSIGYKIPLFLIYALAIFAEYGYQKGLGRFSEMLDIESVFRTNDDQKTAALMTYLNFAALVPCAVLLFLLIFTGKKKPDGYKLFVSTIILAFTFFAGNFYFNDDSMNQKFPSSSLNAFFDTNLDFFIFNQSPSGLAAKLSGFEPVRRQIRQPNLPADYRPANNVILVIDESIRGDHLSLNGYKRPTTPYLEKLASEHKLFNFGIAASAATATYFSHNAIITGLKPENFPDKSKFKITTYPTIYQFAKAMKYETYYFDGQMKSLWSGIDDDKKYFDHWEGVNEILQNGEVPGYEYDNVIARKVNKIISSSTGNFIVVAKRGSHISYQNNFPATAEIWKPSYKTDDFFGIPGEDKLPEVVNAYDNSLKYNIDSFFKNLIGDGENIPDNTVIIYTGDHGQTLYANGKASHGGITRDEAAVPLFIISKDNLKMDTAYKASHQNIFPTILDLIGYPDELREGIFAPSLLKAKASDSKPRFFNPDLGPKIPFD